IPAALGTDSLSSNTDLDLFKEAAFTLDHYPELDPAALLTMMTLGGARALGLDDEFGSIEAGKRAALLAVRLSGSASELHECIIHKGKEGEWQWAAHPANG
ncbi:MAG: amidohydrolase family protein, partial [Acidobacteriota bacterium]